MAGTAEGAAKARKTMAERYGSDWARKRSLKASETTKQTQGEDFHSRIGSRGGKTGGSMSSSNFKNDRERASEAGRLGQQRKQENMSADNLNEKGEQ